jgi:hypothetical protein
MGVLYAVSQPDPEPVSTDSGIVIQPEGKELKYNEGLKRPQRGRSPITVIQHTSLYLD